MYTHKTNLLNLLLVAIALFALTNTKSTFTQLQTVRPLSFRVPAQTIVVAGKQTGIEPLSIDNSNVFSLGAAMSLSFPAPDYPAGMDFDPVNNQILMVSEESGTLYVINPNNGAVIRTVPLPGISEGSYGIAVANNFWWHSDYIRAKLYKLSPANGAVLAELPMPSRYFGIAWDGSNLWGVDHGNYGDFSSRKLYRIDTTTGNILETIPLPTINGPIDLTWDGTNLWVSEIFGVDIHRIDAFGNILRTESFPSGFILKGIALQSPYIWVGVSFPEASLYRVDIRQPLYLPLVIRN